MSDEAHEWRCFHCDEVFTTVEAARDHFGDGGGCDPEPPACKLNQMEGGLLKLYREALAEIHTYQIEDNASFREFYALGADHATALRREEEKGYARGLRDGRAGEVVWGGKLTIDEVADHGGCLFPIEADVEYELIARRPPPLTTTPSDKENAG